MSTREPVTELHPDYSSATASPIPWSEGRALLADAEVFWISTVRPDGRPHVTPLLAVWLDDALHFCTGAHERKALNLAENPAVVMTTGSSALHDGVDLVIEGAATRIVDDATLQGLADAWEAKYGEEWHFEVRDGAFVNDHGGEALVFAVTPTTAFAFAKGDYGQTRWRFG